ncbi:MAG: thymidylate kinase [Candidatus Moranbacteria bacterium]|nr:thymidylate kinase [Candidatus Moranbacteria bacterium]
MKWGKLIVLDGADGSGKATQAKLLLARLKKEGYHVKALDFPQYEDNFFGELIGRSLAGEYGDFIAVDPHIASTLYAADRFESKPKLEKWLKAGNVVVLDRYVSANQIHQGGKITDVKKRKEFLRWLDTLEFTVFGFPRPDMVLYLDVPQAISDKLLLQGKQGVSQNRAVKGKKDLAEKNKKYLAASRESALKIVEQGNNWKRIACAPKGELLSREAIAELVWKKVKAIV